MEQWAYPVTGREVETMRWFIEQRCHEEPPKKHKRKRKKHQHDICDCETLLALLKLIIRCCEDEID